MNRALSRFLWLSLMALFGAALSGGTAVPAMRIAIDHGRSAIHGVSSVSVVQHGWDARAAGQAAADIERGSRFAFVDAYVDSGDKPLAAYQFELTASGPGVALVGVEGGDAPAFADPPYYDPKANLQNRIIIAAFSAAADLPRGRTRVARVMVRLTGAAPAHWSARLDVAADPDARPINAQIQVSQGEAP